MAVFGLQKKDSKEEITSYQTARYVSTNEKRLGEFSSFQFMADTRLKHTSLSFWKMENASDMASIT